MGGGKGEGGRGAGRGRMGWMTKGKGNGREMFLLFTLVLSITAFGLCVHFVLLTLVSHRTFYLRFHG